MKELTKDDCMNWWLERYHDTNLKQIKDKHPELLEDSQGFYDTYKVTQEQHDEWYDWFIDAFSKHCKMSKELAERYSGFTYLDVSPTIIKLSC